MPFIPSDFNLGILKSLWLDWYEDVIIVERLNCSVKTVKKWIARFRDNPGRIVSDTRQNNPGRPLKVSNEDLQRVIHRIEETPFMPVYRLPDEMNLGVTEKILRTAIKKRTEMRFRIAAKKPLLSAKVIDERLRYANEHIHWGENDWRHVFALHEKVFSTSKDGRRGVWRMPNSRYEAKNVIKKVNNGRVNRSYWACASGDGPGAIVEIDRKMKSIDYRLILNDVLLPTVLERYPRDERIYIIEDNSRVRTAKIIKEWYRNNNRLIRLNHPTRSPN
ncbi:hypothetical protein TKK_0003107 [Trichogramma kaykai]